MKIKIDPSEIHLTKEEFDEIVEAFSKIPEQYIITKDKLLAALNEVDRNKNL